MSLSRMFVIGILVVGSTGSAFAQSAADKAAAIKSHATVLSAAAARLQTIQAVRDDVGQQSAVNAIREHTKLIKASEQAFEKMAATMTKADESVPSIAGAFKEFIAADEAIKVQITRLSNADPETVRRIGGPLKDLLQEVQ